MAYELEDEGQNDRLPDNLPTYEELAFGDEEWMEELVNEPIPDPEPPRLHRSGSIGLTLVFFLLIGILLSLISHQQYDVGYANGEKDVATQAYSAGEQQGMNVGYQDGEHQGKVEAMVGLQQWEYDHNCAMSKDGFVSLQVTMGSDNQYSFECVVKK